MFTNVKTILFKKKLHHKLIDLKVFSSNHHFQISLFHYIHIVETSNICTVGAGTGDICTVGANIGNICTVGANIGNICTVGAATGNIVL